MKRRQFLKQSVAVSSSLLAGFQRAVSQDGMSKSGYDRSAAEPLTDPVYGMLLGALLGDAAGGPVEFLSVESRGDVLPNYRSWHASRKMTESDFQQICDDFQLPSYEDLRPEPAPLGPWKSKAAAGTITDDSRFKIILMRAVRQQLLNEKVLTEQSIARQIVDFEPIPGRTIDSEYQELVTEGLQEFRYAAHWVLGERDQSLALPPDRQWGGVATCAGQMLMLPVAAVFPGRPDDAYRTTWHLDFVDSSYARDFCAALNAGLAAIVDPAVAGDSREAKGELFLNTVRSTDPYRLQSVPYVGRPLLKWLDLSTDIANQADGSVAKLFQLLESRGEPKYWWDAHFTFLVPLTILQFCQFRAVPAVHLCLDFGHDTDSYAQLAGAIGGAIESAASFPTTCRKQVRSQLKHDYDEDPVEWADSLRRFAVIQSKK